MQRSVLDNTKHATRDRHACPPAGFEPAVPVNKGRRPTPYTSQPLEWVFCKLHNGMQQGPLIFNYFFFFWEGEANLRLYFLDSSLLAVNLAVILDKSYELFHRPHTQHTSVQNNPLKGALSHVSCAALPTVRVKFHTSWPQVLHSFTENTC